MSKPKKVILGVVIVLAILIVVAAILVRKVQGPPPETGATALKFQEIPFPHTHKGDLKKNLPFVGLATVDSDGDGVDEIIVGGGKGQADIIYSYAEDGFKVFPITGLEKSESDTTYGIASIDTNGDGPEELFIARGSGVYFAENTGGAYRQRKLEFGIDEKTNPLSIALGDINRDGFVDLYISGYIKVKFAEGTNNFRENYGGYSYLLLNDGTNNWTDISKEAGIFSQHNRFVAVFADLNSDSYPDIVVAEDTGKVEIWENKKDLSFERKPDTTVYSYPMGIGVGDIDNDGDVDLYFSNTGSTLPEAMLRGSLTDEQKFNKDYILLQNDGDFKFFRRCRREERRQLWLRLGNQY